MTDPKPYPWPDWAQKHYRVGTIIGCISSACADAGECSWFGLEQAALHKVAYDFRREPRRN